MLPTLSMAEKRRLNYTCRRGTRELETLVHAFLEHHFDQSNAEQKSVFRWLLSMEDDLLWDWIYLWGNDPNATQAKTTHAEKNQVKKAIEEYIANRKKPPSMTELPLSGLEPESKA